MCQACGRKWALSLGRAEYGTDKDGNSIGATPEQSQGRPFTGRYDLSSIKPGDDLGNGLIAAPVEASELMLNAVHGSIGAYLTTLSLDHPWQAKGWLQGAKMAAVAKASIRYRAMIAALRSTGTTKGG